ncbi:MAG: IclR family transcriptional regulator, partial [Candidatus Aminicenantes bacterium]|nr:IclR family transcriptional regulator [Candidatus Aminicenantes bacterium]
ILGINKTTAFRNLKTLEELNILERINNLYYLGISLFEMGSKVYLKQIIIEKIHPILRELSEEVNETVNLAKIHNGMVLYLDKIESKRSLQIQSSIGDTLPLYCTSLGKSILSILPENEMREIIKNISFEKTTHKTISNPKKLIEQINEIKLKGHSIDDEEFEEGLICISVPLYLKHHNFYGSFSLSGPSIRFDQATLLKLSKKLKKYKDIIIEKLKH